MISVVKMVVMSAEIIMASISFIRHSFKLIDVFSFYLLMLVLFDLVDKQSGSF